MTEPTHEELLAWVDEQIAFIQSRIFDEGNYDPVTYPAKASLLANRDVLVRHGELVNTKWDDTYCLECDGYKIPFPCPTYLDVADRLREVMGE